MDQKNENEKRRIETLIWILQRICVIMIRNRKYTERESTKDDYETFHLINYFILKDLLLSPCKYGSF